MSEDENPEDENPEDEKLFVKNVSWEELITHLRLFVEHKVDEVNEASQKEIGRKALTDPDYIIDRVMTLVQQVIPEHAPVEMHLLRQTLDYAMMLGAASAMVQALEEVSGHELVTNLQDLIVFLHKMNDGEVVELIVKEAEEMCSTEGRNNPDSKQETIDRLNSAESIEQAAFGGNETMSSEQIIEAFKLSSN